ncbi:MAG: SBBP repeat-containing protein [Acidobacteriota bacterium]
MERIIKGGLIISLAFAGLLQVLGVAHAEQTERTAGMVNSWVARFNGGAGKIDWGSSIAVDAGGNVYVAGMSTAANNLPNYLLVKYSPTGGVLWSKPINLSGSDEAIAVALGASGDVYVTGYSNSADSFYQFLTYKFSTTGKPGWTTPPRFSAGAGTDNYAAAMAVDAAENVIVTGTSSLPGNKTDIWTVKYDTSGQVVWLKSYQGAANGNDTVSSIAVDSVGNVVIGGVTEDLSGKRDFLVVKYAAANGDVLWSRTWGGSGGGDDAVMAMAVDGDGDVYVTGLTNGDTTMDYMTIKYSRVNGDRIWSVPYNGVAGKNDMPYGIKVDGSKNVYVTGYSEGADGKQSFATLKYDASGTPVWSGARLYRGYTNGNSWAKYIGVDSGGNVYITGSSEGLGNFADYTTVKYNSSGAQLWAKRYDGTLGRNDYARASLLDSQGNVHVTGRSQGTGKNDDLATVTFSGVNNLKSQFLNSDPRVEAILRGGTYNMDDPDWLTGTSDQNKNTFAYKIFMAFFMLGYQTERGTSLGDSRPQLAVLHQFQQDNGLPVTNNLTRAAILKLDPLLVVREKKLASLGKAFPLADHMQPLHSNDVSRETVAYLYQLAYSVLPPTLRMDKGEMVQCTAGQCVGDIQDASGQSWPTYPVDTKKDYRFVGAYFQPNPFAMRMPSATVNFETILHEYAHYLDGWFPPGPDDLPHWHAINTMGFHNISFDMPNQGSDGCSPRRSDDPKDFISAYGYASNYGCSSGTYQFMEEFAEAFQIYIASGRHFREAAKQSKMVADKYNWLKNNVFQGKEYDTDLTQGLHSGCNDVPGVEGNQPGYTSCRESYIWDYTLPLLSQ